MNREELDKKEKVVFKVGLVLLTYTKNSSHLIKIYLFISLRNEMKWKKKNPTREGEGLGKRRKGNLNIYGEWRGEGFWGKVVRDGGGEVRERVSG